MDGLTEYILSNWEAIASDAWRYYLEFGRGAVTLLRGRTPSSVEVGYLCEDDAPQWKDAGLVELIKRYSPESQFVVVVIFGNQKASKIIDTPEGYKRPRELKA